MAIGVGATTCSVAVGSSSLTVAKPACTVAGDVLVAMFARNNSSGIPIETAEFSNTSFGHAFIYKAAGQDLDLYVRIVGSCDPCCYTFTVRAGSLLSSVVILDRLTCAAFDWDENHGVPVAYSSDASQASCYPTTCCIPYNACKVCGDPCTARNYVAYVGYSGGGGVGVPCPTPSDNSCYTNRGRLSTSFFGVWLVDNFKTLTGVTCEDACCFSVNACINGHMKPTSFLIRETDPCICICLSCCTPVVESFTSSFGCCTCCLTITYPCCIDACDLLILVVTRCSCSQGIALGCGTGCSGWALADRHEAALAFPRDIDILWKTANGTEDGTCVTFCAGGGSDRYVMQMLRVTGAALQAPGCLGVTEAVVINPSAPCTLIGLSEPNLVITGLGVFGEITATFLRGHVSPIGFCLINRTEGGGTNSTKVVSMIAQKGYQHTNSNAPPWLICNCLSTTAWTIGIAPSGTDSGCEPLKLTELCVFNYRGITGTASAKDICFILCVLEWREKIETGAIVLGVGLYENIAFSLNFADINIKLTAILPPNHGEHPLIVDACCNAIVHLPDFVDIEEAAIAFNQIGIAKDKVSISLPLPAGIRTYEGVIESVALITPPGTVFRQLILNFQVAWNPSFPTLRVWNDE